MDTSNETIENQLSIYNLERLRGYYVEFYMGEIDIFDKKYIRRLHDEVSEIFDENNNDFADYYEIIINNVPMMIDCVDYDKTLYDYYSIVNTDYFIKVPENIAKLKSMRFIGDPEPHADEFILPKDIMRKLSEVFLDQFKQRYKGIYRSTNPKFSFRVGYKYLSNGTKDIIRKYSVFSDNAIILRESTASRNIILMINSHDYDTYVATELLKSYISDKFRLIKRKLEKMINFSSTKQDAACVYKEMSGLSNEITNKQLYEYYKIIAEYLNTTQKFLNQNLRLVTNNDGITMRLVSN